MRPARLRGRLSSAHVIACVALFIALGSSAAAAVTLARDSVGSPQIRKDAVRSPEIQKDAVRSPEIQKDAVRTSEIRDAGINAADISTGAATALRGDLHVAEEKDVVGVPECDGVDLRDCPNLLVLPLASGDTSRTAPAPGPGPGQPVPGPQQPKGSNWLVQARTTLLIQARNGSAEVHCGLVNPNVSGPAAVLDDFRVIDLTFFGHHVVTLSGVLKKSAGNQTVALRCTTEDGDDNNEVISTKMTALEVGAVTGP